MSQMKWIGVLRITICMLIVTGCSSQKLATDQTVIPASAAVLVTRNGSDLPGSCMPSAAADLIIRFFTALYTGDQLSLNTFFDKDFNWYSITQGISGDPTYQHFVAYTHDDLYKYFAKRHSHQERFYLREVSVGAPNAHNSVDISFILSREAQDIVFEGIPVNQTIVGKGAINCDKQTINVWSMGVWAPSDELPIPAPLCPIPSDKNSATVPIACARSTEQ